MPDDARGEWRQHAACKGTAPADGTREDHPFFPRPTEADDVEAAKAVCAGCPVRRPCLAFAMAQWPAADGVWGGTSEADRNAIRTGERRAAAAG